MQGNAVIGPSIQITGTVSAQEPLTLAGRVNGSVEVAGHLVTVAATAQVEGDITAEAIVVSGRTRGKLHGSARVTVHESATVEGQLVTPILSVENGAVLKAKVDAAGRRGGNLRLAS
jgi:cytoskeletal protein CcmA (bactofilin family)